MYAFGHLVMAQKYRLINVINENSFLYCVLHIIFFLNHFICTWPYHLKVKQLLSLHITTVSVWVNLFYTAKNGRIFPWAEFSDSIYYLTPGRPLLRHGWSSVHSAVCSETLYILVITGGNCQLLRFDSPTPAPLCGVQTQRPNWKCGDASHQGSEIRLWKKKNPRYPMLFVYSL